MDGSVLPPCQKVLTQKIKHAHLIAYRWNSVTLVQHSPISPVESGWTMENDSYIIMWAEDDSTEEASYGSDSDDTNDDESDASSSDSKNVSKFVCEHNKGLYF
ncbi:hypothetical protein LOTGIDRAFT_153667 [Lottia gigantea]|uniref:Uncharacterized protein n=1 Tax=Lottia gigantea TaxID=225164 RepID=V4AD28_LOTGI|nr:hypothetical protein LOTGIDRAFT_153667 [Lottia gigantea]ESO91236.1 hypothetical protein LOTGIDRAFT_153667 [Lottia gigantea]